MSTWADEYITLLDDCEAREDRCAKRILRAASAGVTRGCSKTAAKRQGDKIRPVR